MELWQDVIVDCANRVYQGLGAGYSESVYHTAMEVEFRDLGLNYETKSVVPILYRGRNVGYGIADFIVSDGQNKPVVVVELKAVTYAPRSQEKAQIQTYLRSRPDVVFGLLINFRQPTTTSAECSAVDVCRVDHLVPEVGISRQAAATGHHASHADSRGAVPFLHAEKQTQSDDAQK